ncbi:MAG: hypothetical protein AAGB12_10900 [Pseudomonadota bacterium]
MIKVIFFALFGIVTLALGSLAVRAETYVVAVESLNVRAKPGINTTKTETLRGGTQVTQIKAAKSVRKNGHKWIRVMVQESTFPAGWVSLKYLQPANTLKTFRSKKNQAIVIPGVNIDTVLIVTDDGFYREIYPAGIKGNHWGCEDSYREVKDLCIYDGDQLYSAQNIIAPRSPESPWHARFKLQPDGTLCSFLLEPESESQKKYRVCSDDKKAEEYLEKYAEFWIP